tara:strand:- start:412 stop:1065 length:654 start_codon:yes stop_codon:yes gene_type:complete
MQLSLPAEFSDLTLKGLMTIQSTDDPVQWVSTCGNVTPEYVKKMPVVLFDKAKEHLSKIMAAETALHPLTIKHNGIEYGFIPSWSEFTTGEWIDIEMFADDFWENADKIMSLLYRPITRKFGKRYDIEDYTAKEDREIFHDLSASYFAGAMLFFCNSRNKHLNALRQSLSAIAVEAMKSAQNGGGTITCSTSPANRFLKWMRSRASRLKSFFSTSHI